ncbi:MAG: HEAT repeat domain-containing protein [Candidatus Omnitrophica bacterium]|nr:HEAT repeat domain-containing protein [Candidatus Omnitrophota bacterium]
MTAFGFDHLWTVNAVLGALWLLTAVSMIALNAWSHFLESRAGRGGVFRPLNGGLEDAEPFELKRKFFKSWNRWQKIEALTALAHRAPEQASELIGIALKSKIEDVRYFALVAAGIAKTPECAELLVKSLDLGDIHGMRIASLLENFPESAMPAMEGGLDHVNPRVRAWIIRVLTQRKQTPFNPSILQKADDLHPAVRAAVFEYLGEHRMAENLIAQGLYDKVWFVRAEACRALGRMHPERHAAQFIRLMIHDPSTLVKTVAEKNLLKNIDAAMPAIRECLENGPRLSQRICVQALVESGETANILLNNLSRDPKVRAEASSVLRALLKTNIFFGLNHQLERFAPEIREQLVAIITNMEPSIAPQLTLQGKGQ